MTAELTKSDGTAGTFRISATTTFVFVSQYSSLVFPSLSASSRDFSFLGGTSIRLLATIAHTGKKRATGLFLGFFECQAATLVPHIAANITGIIDFYCISRACVATRPKTLPQLVLSPYSFIRHHRAYRLLSKVNWSNMPLERSGKAFWETYLRERKKARYANFQAQLSLQAMETEARREAPGALRRCDHARKGAFLTDNSSPMSLTSLIKSESLQFLSSKRLICLFGLLIGLLLPCPLHAHCAAHKTTSSVNLSNKWPGSVVRRLLMRVLLEGDKPAKE